MNEIGGGVVSSPLEQRGPESRVWTTIDFSSDGKAFDFLRVPQSTNQSAYGWVGLPIAVIKNGEGPVVSLISGSHGDEYEGQIALQDLARSIRSNDISGTLIIMPSLNFPAVAAGTRVSPIDEVNLNRAFPGSPTGTITQMIAHYVATEIVKLSDLIVDLHSGGRSLDHALCALVPKGNTELEQVENRRLLSEFGAPIGFFTDGLGGGGQTTLSAACQRAGKRIVTAELGGGAASNEAGIQLAKHGVLRLLNYLGICSIKVPRPEPVTFVTSPNRDFFMYAMSDGLFQPSIQVGEYVSEGQFAGYLHPLTDLGSVPETLTFETSGILLCRRFPCLARLGDCLYEIAEPI